MILAYSDPALVLWQGDALRVLQELPDASVDAVITDPPYSSGGQYRGDRAGFSTAAKYVRGGTGIARPDFSGDNRDQRGFAYWCALWMSEALRVARPGSPICVFTDWRQLPTTTDSLQAGGGSGAGSSGGIRRKGPGRRAVGSLLKWST
jgi:site-specific DNA-methyltransferase (adenine-specific)